ncbi:hypothetical protein MTO96_031902 [Rhipicephalus appendiculatus]
MPMLATTRLSWRSPVEATEARSESRRNVNQRSRSRAAVFRASAETRPRRDGSLGQQPSFSDGRPCARHRNHLHRRRCRLTPSLVSTG